MRKEYPANRALIIAAESAPKKSRPLAAPEERQQLAHCVSSGGTEAGRNELDQERVKVDVPND